MAGSFSNLSARPPSRFLRLLRRLSAGVDKVENEIVPYASAWHEHNITALAGTDPLWVVFGDSLSQGVGASSIDKSWVLQAHRMLAEQGITYRVLNLSISGATVGDVLEREIPAMRGLAAEPDLVTVLIGSNDIIHRDLRDTLVVHYEQLLAALPRGSLVAVPEHPRGTLAGVTCVVEVAASTGAVHPVAARLGSRQRAEDHFHPNDAAYALIALDFAKAIADSLNHADPTTPIEDRP